MNGIRRKPKRKELLILVVGALLGVFSFVHATPRQAVISIPDYEEEDSEHAVFYRKGEETGKLLFTIPARVYSDEQLNDMAEQAFSELAKRLPGDNPSMDEVRLRLVFSDVLPEFPFAVSWQSENTTVITGEGEVMNEGLEEAVLCVLVAELSYEDYIATREYCVRVLPREYTSQELFEEALKKEIIRYVEKERGEKVGEEAGEEAAGSKTAKDLATETDEIILPDSMLGAELYGNKPDVAASLIYPFLGIVGVVFMRVRQKESAREAEKKRKEELLYAYPVFVNQLALYLSAGMTVRAAINQLAIHWNRQSESHMKALLTEVHSMLQMMQNGISEKEAYRSFGRACGHQEYQKLMALLIQTIEIGGKGVLNSLETLEAEAFLMRKEQARLRGETASTKLLLPMILLLAVVMVLLMVPGFYGMGM